MYLITFTQVMCHSQRIAAAAHFEGLHFLTVYACAYIVSFPDHRLLTMAEHEQPSISASGLVQYGRPDAPPPLARLPEEAPELILRP